MFWSQFGLLIIGPLIFVSIIGYLVLFYQPQFDLGNTILEGADVSVQIAIIYIKTILVLFLLFGIIVGYYSEEYVKKKEYFVYNLQDAISAKAHCRDLI